MTTLEYIIGALLLIIAVTLVVIIMLQESKQRGLSATLAGGNDSYYGKNKGRSKQKILIKATTILAVVFALLVLALYVFQGADFSSDDKSSAESSEISTVSSGDKSADESDTSEETSAASTEESAQSADESAVSADETSPEGE